MSNPSISVMKCASDLRASHLHQSYSVAQKRASFRIVASCEACDESVTVSRSGHLGALIRLLSSVIYSSGKDRNRKGTNIGGVATSLLRAVSHRLRPFSSAETTGRPGCPRRGSVCPPCDEAQPRGVTLCDCVKCRPVATTPSQHSAG